MRLGANLWIWEGVVDEAAIERGIGTLTAIGADVIEIPYERIGAWDPQRVRASLNDVLLKPAMCIAMAPGRDLTTTDGAVVAATQDYLRTAIAAAQEIGAQVIGGPMYSPTGHTGVLSPAGREAKLDRLATNLGPVLADAEAAGVRLALEPLNRFETSLFNVVEQAVPFIDRLGTPALGLLLDTFHMNIEEADMVAAIRMAGHRIVHVHACGNNRSTPRHGSIPWRGVLAALRAVDYRGDLVIESFTGDNETIAAAASVWRPLAANQTAIATDGIQFLRGLLTSEAA